MMVESRWQSWHLRWMTALIAVLIAVFGVAFCASPALSEPVELYTFLDEECEAEFDLTCTLAPLTKWGAEGHFRLVFNYEQGKGGYVLTVSAQRMQLFKVSGSQWQLVGKVLALPPEALTQEFTPTLKRRAGRVALLCNGQIILRVNDRKFTGGKVGFFTRPHSLLVKPLRYQSIEHVFFTDDFVRGADEKDAWSHVFGEWKLNTIGETKVSPERVANAFTYCAKAKAEGRALAVTGYWFWDTYTFSTAVKPKGNGAVGLVALYQDPQDYLLFRWKSSGRGGRELVVVKGGKESALDANPGGYEPGQWYKLALRVNENAAEAFIDGQLACRIKSPPFAQGKIGLYAEKVGEVIFDDVEVSHWDGTASLDLRPRPKIAEQFVKENTMSNWARSEGMWTKGEGGTLWHRGDFFGDAFIAALVSNPLTASGTVSLIINSPHRKQEGGYTLLVNTQPQHKKVRLDLKRALDSVRSVERNLIANEPRMEVSLCRRGQVVTAYLNGETVLSFEDPRPLVGRKVGLLVQGLSVPIAQVKVDSSHLLDYTFSDAPTDWWVQRGEWKVQPRWPCDPSWAWFGSASGADNECSILWSKRAFFGDFTLEAYLALQMDLPDVPGYSRPSDLNVTICGDGKDLSSGYSFIFAGWNNTKTAILRKDQLVAETDKLRFTNPINLNFAYHRHWYYIRVEKQGGRLRYFIDNDEKPVLEYTDANPLPSGRIAFWTYRNGLIIARARIWYERIGTAPPFPSLWQTRELGAASKHNEASGANETKQAPIEPAAHKIIHNFEGSLFGWRPHRSNSLEQVILQLDTATASKGRSSLKITNPNVGGDFTVYAGVGSFDAAHFPLLRFDYKVASSVKVNVYLKLRTNDRWHALLFTGGREVGGTAVSLGSIPNVIADSQWHRAEVNLLQLFKALYPNQSSFLIESICFAAPSESYYRCGLGGNPMGCSYHLDNFQLAKT